MVKGIFFILLIASLSKVDAVAQKVAFKTNLLYGAYSYTPNLGMEIGLSSTSTLDIAVGYNPWNLKGNANDNKKLVHLLANVEYRYWLCERFNGHFFGIHALGSQYNISQHELPLLFGRGSKNYRYEGYGYGAGVSYGYQWMLNRRWNLETNIGVGYARLHYDRYDCKNCGQKLGTESRNYFGPTRAAISLIYMIR